MIRQLIFIAPLLLFCLQTKAQNLTHTNQYWMGYMTQSRLSEQWGLWNDIHWVPESFFLIRTGVTYRFKSKYNLSATSGFARLWIYPSQEDLKTFRPEYRPWGQVVLGYNPNKVRHLQRLRIDARFRRNILQDELLDGYDFNWRFRYMYQWRYDFNPNQVQNYFYASVSNEVLFNLGQNINNQFRLDQNRFQLSYGYQMDKLAIQLGYMNFLALENSTNTLNMKHTFLVWIFHQIDF